MESMVWNEEIEMKALLSLFALSLIATGLIGLLTLTLANAAPTLEIRVLAVIGAVLGGYVLMQPLLNRVARRLGWGRGATWCARPACGRFFHVTEGRNDSASPKAGTGERTPRINPPSFACGPHAGGRGSRCPRRRR